VSDRAPSPGTTVLLVEDEEPVRATGRRMLERAGYTVLEARNGRDALRVWQTHRATVRAVVTDLRMPEMDGRDLAAHLRQDAPDLPIVFVSGYGSEGAGAQEPLEPPGTFLQKPFTAEALRAALGRVLRDGAAGVVP
jgi:CheY-like chemotaxis protein